MAGLITNVQTADSYTDAATIAGLWTSRGGNFEVANASVFYQLQYGSLGSSYWTDEAYMSPTAGIIEPGTLGIRFRSFETSKPARVFARIAEGKEPVLTGTQFSGSIGSSGQVVPDVAASASARVHAAANQSLATSVEASISFDSTDYDTNGIVNLAGFPTRLTCQTAGVYSIKGGVRFAFSAAGNLRELSVRLNGGTYIADISSPPAPTAVVGVIVTTDYQLAIGDYLELRAFQDSGGPLNSTFFVNAFPFLSMSKVP